MQTRKIASARGSPRAATRRIKRGTKLEKSMAKVMAVDDSATRWRAVPKDFVKEQGNTYLIPRFFLLDSDDPEALSTEVLGHIRALEQRVSQLETLVSETSGGTVTPMPLPKDRAGHAKPVAVPGNEAEELHPVVQPPVVSAQSNVVKLAAVQKRAANDPRGPHPSEAPTEEQAAIVKPEPPVEASSKHSTWSDEDDMVAFWSEQFNWSPMEIHANLTREFLRRDRQCKRLHKLSYDEVRLRRALMKDRQYQPTDDWFLRSEDTGFKAWSEALPSIPRWKSFDEDLEARGISPPAFHRDHLKWNSSHRKRIARAEAIRKDEIRGKLQGEGFKRELNLSSMLHTDVERRVRESFPVWAKNFFINEPRATLRVLPMKMRDGIDAIYRLFTKGEAHPRGQGRDWGRKRRAKFARSPHTIGNAPTDKASAVIESIGPVDKDVSAGELVRRYQRQGIGY